MGVTTLDDAIASLDTLLVAWRRQIERKGTPTEAIEELTVWMESLVFIIGEARKAEFFIDTLTKAGGRPMEFMESRAEAEANRWKED